MCQIYASVERLIEISMLYRGPVSASKAPVVQSESASDASSIMEAKNQSIATTITFSQIFVLHSRRYVVVMVVFEGDGVSDTGMVGIFTCIR
jgi:hypothetical protein